MSGTAGFPDGFFERIDPSPDPIFYRPPRLVSHIDDAAIAAVSALYSRLEVCGRVLDLMSSWISHLPAEPEHLTVLGMNAAELEANPMADERIVADLNGEPTLPFDDRTFDAALCCVSVDYLTRPVDVFREVARVLRPGRPFVCTFSNRLFPTKAIQGWLAADDQARCDIVAEYFRLSDTWDEPVIDVPVSPGGPGDPLYAVYAYKGSDPFVPVVD